MSIEPRPRPLRPLAAAALGCLALAAGGCRQDMHDQPRLEPLEASTFFADGMASRLPIEGTVARGQLHEDALLHTGRDEAGELATAVPMPVDRALLVRGQQRYGVFCAPCHGATGEGDGMVVQRGFTPPPTFHDERLRQEAVGYFYDVMTNGFGQMPSYAAQVPVRDRWAIAAYLRVLQLSQDARLAELPAPDRRALDEMLATAPPVPAAAHDPAVIGGDDPTAPTTPTTPDPTAETTDGTLTEGEP